METSTKLTIRVAFMMVSLMLPLFSSGEIPPLTEEEKELLATEIPYQIRKDFPYYLTGFGFDGGPIWVVEYSKWPNRKYAEMGSEKLKLVFQHQKQMLLRWRLSIDKYSTPEKPLKNFHFLADVQNYPMGDYLHLPTLQKVMQDAVLFAPAVQTYGKTLTVVNANQAFELVIAVIKPILGQVGERLEILGTNPSRWKPRILKLYPKESLPHWFGGTANSTLEVYG